MSIPRVLQFNNGDREENNRFPEPDFTFRQIHEGAFGNFKATKPFEEPAPGCWCEAVPGPRYIHQLVLLVVPNTSASKGLPTVYPLMTNSCPALTRIFRHAPER